jgi:serine/threonine protein kinase
MTSDEVMAIIREVAECLAVPHSVGMAHRDLKPSNLLLDHRGWKLADFGLGAAIDPRGAAAERRTSAGLSQELRGSGTPLYMCEEQRRGDTANPRHDIYSLGVIWYQMLIGDVSRRLTPEWEEELRDRKVPDSHIALIGRCIRGFKSRPEDGKSLIQYIDAIVYRLDEVKERQLAERDAQRRLMSHYVAYSVGGSLLGGLAIGGIGALIGTVGWTKIVALIVLSVVVFVVTGLFSALYVGLLGAMYSSLKRSGGCCGCCCGWESPDPAVVKGFAIIGGVLGGLAGIFVIIGLINNDENASKNFWKLSSWDWTVSQGGIWGGAIGVAIGLIIAAYLATDNCPRR